MDEISDIVDRYGTAASSFLTVVVLTGLFLPKEWKKKLKIIFKKFIEFLEKQNFKTYLKPIATDKGQNNFLFFIGIIILCAFFKNIIKIYLNPKIEGLIAPNPQIIILILTLGFTIALKFHTYIISKYLNLNQYWKIFLRQFLLCILFGFIWVSVASLTVYLLFDITTFGQLGYGNGEKNINTNGWEYSIYQFVLLLISPFFGGFFLLSMLVAFEVIWIYFIIYPLLFFKICNSILKILIDKRQGIEVILTILLIICYPPLFKIGNYLYSFITLKLPLVF